MWLTLLLGNEKSTVSSPLGLCFPRISLKTCRKRKIHHSSRLLKEFLDEKEGKKRKNILMSHGNFIYAYMVLNIKQLLQPLSCSFTFLKHIESLLSSSSSSSRKFLMYYIPLFLFNHKC